ncbi:thioredoxin domain-containing protein [Desulfocurvibacter africanus]|uniref:thioredoxin domain-containing protein n=1 Tax=Desulfocurvibacter africanus TaxID=873 RepID=UPI0004144F8A|nr:thioredoxin domain-containing protein [Desulfocurvibacter africanus]
MAKHTNRLVGEKSPYLLQHAHNPVDWHPWGEEAFRTATEQDKPVFLSIGYSTCHWCHVMERESFEDDEVAKLLNEAFVCIKVDREERPDIDNVYMTVCQMMTGHGGWPLTVLMTPDKKPFFSGTYFPKSSLAGRMGLMELVPKVQDLWRTRREDLVQSADKVTEALRGLERPAVGGELGDSVLFKAERQLSERFDEAFGGFGGAPKFPTPHNLLLLLRMFRRTGNARNLAMVEKTLTAMRRGGIYDHLGYGFHRYSTDQRWLLPHFEKMLYDQAQLLMAYVEAYQLTRKPIYKRTAQEIVEYVRRDLQHPEGPFYSAEDADSEGEEGKFYVWSEKEIRSVLGKKADPFIRAYDILPEGNFLDEATHRRTGANVLHLQRPLDILAKELGMSELELETTLADQRRLLFHVRERRVRPLRDDKVLTDWNGLMIAALSMAAKALDEELFVRAATAAADFILSRMRKDGRLLHRFRDGEVAIEATLTDYAFLIWGLVELYEAGLDSRHLEAALDLTEIMNKQFWDPKDGGYYFTAESAEQLLVRQKDLFDGAIPSGNSVAMHVLLKLSRLTGRPNLANRAAAVARSAARQATEHPVGFTQLLCGVDFSIGPSAEVVIVGKRNAPETRAMLRKLHASYIPNKVLLLREEGDERMPALAPFTAELVMQDGKATAYVCRGFSCELPVTEPQAMMELLEY